MTDNAIAITGIGAVSPLGLSATDLWEGICSGRSGIKRIEAFDPSQFECKIAGEVPAYKISKHVPKYYRKAVKLMSRDIELAVLASNEAWANSGWITKAADPDNATLNPSRTAINLGAGLISCDLEEIAPAVAHSTTDGHFDIHKWGSEGMNELTPIWLLKYLPNMPGCHVGIIHDIQGPSNVITCGEVGSLIALAEASEIIHRGDADVAMAGGCEAKVNPIVIMRQILLQRAAIEGNDNPETACRPFDINAMGSVFGEGAALLVLERASEAKSRGARIFAEIVGTGSSTGLSPDYTHLESGGEGLRLAIEMALEQAGIGGDQLDLVIPHGTAIPSDDIVESRVLGDILGSAKSQTAVLPTKSMISHTGAASGAMDVIVAAKAIEEGCIPAAKNCEQKAEGCELNIATSQIKKEIQYALCCGYTFGGQTAAIVLKRGSA